MIINSVKASNVLKYASLNLQNLPQQGLIAITGPNESGKSSIGETVCFALFGRTFSLDFDDLTKIIRWDETHCSVELEFTPGDGKRYRLERFLDGTGNHSARLALVGADPDEEPLARGIEQVADRVYQLIGYEYEEFIESFYLAQREITTPHPHSYAVKSMAGLVTLEYCAEACREDHQETLVEIEARREDLERQQAELDELDIDPRQLTELQAERDAIVRRVAEANKLIKSFDDASINYQDALPKRKRALAARGRNGFWGFLCLILAISAGTGWYLLAQLSTLDLAARLSALLSSRLAFWRPEMVPWLLYAAIIFAFLFLFLIFRRNLLGNQIREMERVAQDLSAILDDLPEADNASSGPATTQGGEPAEATTEAVASATGGEPAVEEAVDRAARGRLSQRITDWQASAQEVRDGVGGEQNLLRQELEEIARRKGELDLALATEQARLDQAERLSAIADELQAKISAREQHVETCTLAEQLIEGASREVSHRFNRKLRGLVSKTLPLFTENRYEHLQIEDDLSVRAFSSEKRDFMDLDEISSGTQRQIMLAVRLALSQELVGRVVKQCQFLFLDEPFAFFDEKRTRSALTVLPTLSEELNQIWIIGQAFADDLHFDLHIQCERGQNSILLAD